MKYISLDLETTSLIPNPNHIIMASMIVDDTDPNSELGGTPAENLPHFTAFVKQYDETGENYHGQAGAMAMNAWIFKILSDSKETPPYPIHQNRERPDNKLRSFEEAACSFINEHFRGADGKFGRATLAGKNVMGFDLQFLPPKLKSKFRHRAIDVGTLMWLPSDELIPDLKTCKERCNINTPVAHDAYQDALDVIRVIRYNNTQKRSRPSKHSLTYSVDGEIRTIGSDSAHVTGADLLLASGGDLYFKYPSTSRLGKVHQHDLWSGAHIGDFLSKDPNCSGTGLPTLPRGAFIKQDFAVL